MATLGLPGVDTLRLWPCLAAVTQRHGFKIRLCFTRLCGRVDSAVRTHHEQLTHVPANTGWPHCLAAADPAAVNVRVKCLDVDPQFSWSRTRERNCWFLGNTVLSRLTGTASLMSLFTLCRFYLSGEAT